MAVYERSYRGFAGKLTPGWMRFLVLPRYAYRDVFRSKLFTGYFALCLGPPLLAMLFIYLQHNMEPLQNLGINLVQAFPITAKVFKDFLWFQALVLGFLLVLIVGPGLISGDLRNNALPLYLGRPFSRAEYVLGKMSVLAILLSVITWVPGLMVFALNAYFEGWSWFTANLHIPFALFAGSWLYILFISLLVLALSAWVRFKSLASGLLIVFIIVTGAFSRILNGLLGTEWGSLLNFRVLVESVWAALFRVPEPELLPAGAAAITLLGLTAFSLLLLQLKIRAYEVVR